MILFTLLVFAICVIIFYGCLLITLLIITEIISRFALICVSIFLLIQCILMTLFFVYMIHEDILDYRRRTNGSYLRDIESQNESEPEISTIQLHYQNYKNAICTLFSRMYIDNLDHNDCPICLDDDIIKVILVEENENVKLKLQTTCAWMKCSKCNNTIHAECMCTTLVVHPTCPLCRG